MARPKKRPLPDEPAVMTPPEPRPPLLPRPFVVTIVLVFGSYLGTFFLEEWLMRHIGIFGFALLLTYLILYLGLIVWHGIKLVKTR